MTTMQGDDLRALRGMARMTQGQFAEALGFSQGFIGEMERGEKPIERRTVLAALYVADHADQFRDALSASGQPIDGEALKLFCDNLYRQLLASISRRP